MGRALLLIALCLLPALACASRAVKNPFSVEGRVYCDTCRAGFETSATTYVPGATVKVECRDRKSLGLVYEKEGMTDSTGSYKILVDEDHEDQLCDAILLKSSQKDCSKVSPGRERARVILTRFNGIATNNRFANAMGFDKDEPESDCTQILQLYKVDEDDL